MDTESTQQHAAESAALDTAHTTPLPSSFSWSAYEHEHIERTPDWYWALGISALCIALTAALFHNILFGLVIVMAALAVALISRTHPPLTHFEVTERGIKIGPTLHDYKEIIGFWIETDPELVPQRHFPLSDDEADGHALVAHLLIDTTKPLAPNFIIPLADVDYESLRAFLKKYTEERPMKIPVSHKIFEALGF